MAVYLIEPASASPSDNYGNIYSTISNHLKDISDSLSKIKSNSTIVADQIKIIAEKHSAIESYQKKVKELAEGTGVHIIGPWEWIGLVSLYKLFIEEGKILEDSKDVDPEKFAEAMQKFNNYIEKIKTLPTIY